MFEISDMFLLGAKLEAEEFKCTLDTQYTHVLKIFSD
jgi:hypothetical protein